MCRIQYNNDYDGGGDDDDNNNNGRIKILNQLFTNFRSVGY